MTRTYQLHILTSTPVFTRSVQFGCKVPKEERQTLPQLASGFVAMFRKTIFDGWPGAVHYIPEEHEPRLRKIRHLLPGRLSQTHTYLLWGYLTAAVNKARAEERKAYLRQVQFGADHVGEQ